MKRIAMICPYFGKFPSNIELTFKSMEANGFIDWYIFTNIKNIYGDFKNIKFINMSFEDIKKIIKEKIGTDIKSVYKLCDYKPTYGYIFESYIHEYEYWGFCDLDVIFGDLSKYLNSKKTEEFFKIYDLGHLSILKNTRETREAFRDFEYMNKNYADILNSEYIFVFDETYDEEHKGINGVLEQKGLKIYTNRKEYADLDIKYNNFYPNYYQKEKHYYFKYQNNKLLLENLDDKNFEREVAYVHLQQKKNLKIFDNITDDFMVTPKGFFNIQTPTKKMFYKINFKTLWYFKFRIKRKINNYKRNKEIGERW